jgi:hypothetical protein
MEIGNIGFLNPKLRRLFKMKHRSFTEITEELKAAMEFQSFVSVNVPGLECVIVKENQLSPRQKLKEIERICIDSFPDHNTHLSAETILKIIGNI